MWTEEDRRTDRVITTGHPQILAGPNNLSFNLINSKERRFLIEAIPDDTSFLTKIFHYWNLEQMGPTCRISVISAPGKSPSFRTGRSQSLDKVTSLSLETDMLSFQGQASSPFLETGSPLSLGHGIFSSIKPYI